MEQRLPKLDPRLAVIASMVRDGERCADIGTDHGMLLAWLVASGKVPFGYACDINEKPLNKAAFTMSAYGVKDRVKLLLCNGLDGLEPNDAGDIVIAGMGGELIRDIISRAAWARDARLRFILQPMTKAEELRRALCRNGFEIFCERAVVSGNFPYAVMQVGYTGVCCELDDLTAWAGPFPGDPTPAAQQYVEKAAKLVRERVHGLGQTGNAGLELVRYANLLYQLEGDKV